jgi:hypothetical protein
MAKGETEDEVKKKVIIGCFAFFYMSLYTSLYGVMYYSVRLRKSDCERARDLHCDAEIQGN